MTRCRAPRSPTNSVHLYSHGLYSYAIYSYGPIHELSSQSADVGLGVGDGVVGDGVGLGVGDGVGEGVGLGEGSAVGAGVGQSAVLAQISDSDVDGQALPSFCGSKLTVRERECDKPASHSVHPVQ